MLELVFYVGDDRYGLPIGQIVEVIPAVPLRPLHGAPAYVAGILNYRRQLIPVVDLRKLSEGHPCERSLSTRIIVASEHGATSDRLIGLMAERVTEVSEPDESDEPDSPPLWSSRRLEELLPEELRQ